MRVKILITLFLMTFSVSSFAQDNPLLGKWTRTQGDCKKFVYEYGPTTHYYIVKKYLVMTKRKKLGGDITYKINLPYVTFTWVQSIKIDGKIISRSVHEYVKKFENRNTIREVFYRSRSYSRGELVREEWEKEDGSKLRKIKVDGVWRTMPMYGNLRRFYRCQ